MFQKPKVFYIKKADYGFGRDLYLLFDAELSRTCSPLTHSCCNFCFFCFDVVVVVVATGRHVWYGLCRTLWLQPRGRLSSHHGLLSLSTRMVRCERNRHEEQWEFPLWWDFQFCGCRSSMWGWKEKRDSSVAAVSLLWFTGVETLSNVGSTEHWE